MHRALVAAAVVLSLATACGARELPPHPHDAYAPFPASSFDTRTPVLTAVPAPRDDGRLPDLATPLRYALALRIDPERARFSGRATILVRVAQPTSNLVLHGRDLRVTRAIARVGAGEVVASVSSRTPAGGTQEEELVLAFPRALPRGTGVIELDYDAPFGDDLAGLYRVKDGGRWYAFSQFESTDARRAFPCFDEPAWKTPYDVRVTVPRGMLALSNAEETARHDEPSSDTVTFDFATTRPIPSYLVAFAIGDLDIRAATTRGKTGVPIRVVATRGKAHLGDLALEATTELVDRLGDYFDVRYPYSKLDLVAVPDFAAGAMENPGLITFRDEILLVSPSSGVSARTTQAVTIAHELTHMWLGDLVTMRWWDDLWLKEGLATWMESKVVDAWRPELGARLDAIAGIGRVMDVDAMTSARAIRAPIRTSSEASAAFDDFAYDKAAAVMRMIEAYVGEDAFQRALRAFVREHAWGTVRAEDLLRALDTASRKDVSGIANTFLSQPGVPVVRLTWETREGEAVVGLEARPWASEGATPAPRTWKVPVCIDERAGGEPPCVAFDKPMTLPKGHPRPAFLYPNAREAGYFRTSLPEKEIEALVAHRAELDAATRLGLMSNLWAMTRAGELAPDRLLALLPKLDDETERHVVDEEIALLRGFDEALVEDSVRPAFRAYVAARLATKRRALGWKHRGAAAETEDLLRSSVLEAAGVLAEDGDVLREAERTASAWLKDPRAVDANLAGVAVPLASRRAPASRLDALRAALAGAARPEDRVVALRAMAALGDPAALRRALDLLLTPEIRASDYRHFPQPVVAYRAGRQVFYGWLKAHWAEVAARTPDASKGQLAEIAAFACTPESLAEARAFLGERLKGVESARLPLAQAFERAEACVALRARGTERVTRHLRARGR